MTRSLMEDVFFSPEMIDYSCFGQQSNNHDERDAKPSARNDF